jgi:hypothetical protein
MNVQQAKILLEKINALYKSISMGNDGPSAIERDLMLSYLRQMYEACLPGNSETAAPTREEAPAAKAPAPKPEPAPRTYTAPRVVEIPESLREISTPEPAAKTPPPSPPAPKPEPRPEPRPTPEPVQPAAPVAATAGGNDRHNPKIEALFRFGTAKELSEKLSERPVPDLTRAMAINDKLLYINDLFGKDQNAMDESLKLLNKFDSMDEAKSLLRNLAEQYNWIDEEKVESAQSFIKLVRRKYV